MTPLEKASVADDLAKQLTGYSSIPADDTPEYNASRALRTTGQDWPPLPALTMIGLMRMNNIHELTRRVLEAGVPGDFMECGVWRGGASIYMRKLLDLYGDGHRFVILADSFTGFPENGLRKFACDNINFGPDDYIAVPLDQVRQNFETYGVDLYRTRVVFLEGWFRDVLPHFVSQGRHPLALLRLDGDLYESTMDCLTHLYPHVSPGGYVIVDDYGGLAMCKQAVDEYRTANGIAAPITMVDWTGMWWQKPA